jgi:hypothetical protein
MWIIMVLFPWAGACSVADSHGIDLSNAVVVIRPGELPNAERAAGIVLIEEVEKRTGIRLQSSTEWPGGKPVIAIWSGSDQVEWGRDVPTRTDGNPPERRPEGYRIHVASNGATPVVWVQGADPRGALYGVGGVLRRLQWSKGVARLPNDLDEATAPALPIRGHQLGFRARANSWDAWEVGQFDQYIRELALFGLNSVENIPFEDDRTSPVMKVSRDEMNRRMSDICDRYGLDYWVWTPADFDLNDQAVRDAMLDKHEALYRECKELTGVFFPGGDPGHNLPELVLPFLEDIAKRLIAIHPDARVWLSLQWFNRQQIETIFAYLDEKSPTWLGGLVAGPSSPPVPLTRLRLDKKYKFRLYPDITHNKLCQYPVPWWDQAYVLTLGREAINPRPVQYTHIFQRVAPYSDGFITYSDGVHDDVNKTIWSALGWDPSQNPRDILVEYARFFFMPTVAEDAADGMLALERNWQGALMENGAVDGTLRLWQALEAKAPGLSGNWRWQMNVLRAYYDAYTRKRLLRESHLEELANAALATAGKIGADTAMQRAMGILKQEPVDESLLEGRRRIEQLCEAVFDSIGLQTSVEKYHASGAERGACLDFVDYPLNNRWWLEDEFARIAAMPTESDKLARLEVIRTWETPGPGSFYDDLGNVLKSTHVIRGGNRSGPDELQADRTPTFWWWDDGMSRARLSWQCTLDWPLGVMYEGLDPQASYTVRSTGYGQALLRIDGQRVEPTLDGKEMGEFKEFPVPAEHLQDAKLVLTWDRPTDEQDLNWRQRSRLAEVWLIKK